MHSLVIFINSQQARMLEGVDLTALEVKKFSGADIEPKCEPPTIPQKFSKEEELKKYSGNCHCGAIKFNAKIPELTEVAKCNCSHCSKVYIYSPQ